MRSNLYKFIKLYTPFILAFTAFIHGVLLLLKVKTVLYYLFNCVTGNSLLLMLFVLVHSKRMCKWYKLSIYLLMMIHINNALTYIGVLSRTNCLYVTLFITAGAMIFWLMFITTKNITKTIHSACKHSKEE